MTILIFKSRDYKVGPTGVGGSSRKEKWAGVLQLAGAGRLVLVVDDNPAQRYVACRMLRKANFTTIEASWGREVVEQARRLSPDIILLDMHMPDQSGIVTLQQLRANSRTASIPVVFLTGTAHSPVDKSRAEALGVSAYLFNPVAPDTLVAVVENSILRAKDLAQELNRANGGILT